MQYDAIDVDGTEIRKGTSIYDTEYDRVLWIAEIDDYELMVEVAAPYETEEPIGWSANEKHHRVDDGTLIWIERFRALVEQGRFEVSPGAARE